MDEKGIGLSFQDVNNFTAHKAHQSARAANAPNAKPGSAMGRMNYEDCEAMMGMKDREPDHDDVSPATMTGEQ